MAPRKRNTGWVNFQDYLSVNQDQGKAMADKVAGSVAGAGDAARNQLTNAQSSLATGAQRGGGQGAKQPTTAAEAGSMAAQGYTGPQGLDAVDPNLSASIADATARVARAGTSAGQAGLLKEQYGARGPTSIGGGALDSALLSGVSGSAVPGLQAQYGNLGKEYAAAQKTGDQQVAAGKQAAQATSDHWAQLQQQLAGQEAGQKTAADKANSDAAFEAKWAAAQGSNAVDEVNRAFGSFNSIMSPITQIAENTGNRDPISDWGRNLIDPNAGKNSGGTRGQKIWWQPQHKDVYRQMDPKQWQVLNSLPPQAQQRWLEQRRQEIASGKPAQAFRQAGRDFGTDPHKYL